MMALVSLVLAMVSCRADSADEPTRYADVTFTAQLPTDISLRVKANGPRKAYSDGTKATELYYAVYDAEGTLLPLAAFGDKKYGTAIVTDLKAKVVIKLPVGKTFDVVFFAKAPNAPYTFSAENHNFTIDYSNVKANNDNLDAFYAKVRYDGTSTATAVELKRPFAQLNIGTSDLDTFNAASSTQLTQTALEVTNVGNALDLLSGNVSGIGTQSFKLSAIPTGSFTKDGYKYLAMAYLLVENAYGLVDVTLKSDATSTVGTYANASVKPNYRTNIYGALLTRESNVNVTIDNDYENGFDSSK